MTRKRKKALKGAELLKSMKRAEVSANRLLELKAAERASTRRKQAVTAAPVKKGNSSTGPARAIGNALGGIASTFLGFPEAAPAVSALGGFLADKAVGAVQSLLRGSGDYEMTNVPDGNSLVSSHPAVLGANGYITDQDGVRARFHTEGHGTTFANREFIQGVYSGPTTPDRYTLVFPLNFDQMQARYLRSLGRHFQKAQFHGMVVQWDSSMSQVGPIGVVGLGTIGMAHLRDPLARIPATLEELSVLAGAELCRPSQNMLLAVECRDIMGSAIYVDTDDLVQGDKDRLGSFGQIVVMFEGVPKPAVEELIGRLYLAYDVLLVNPRLPEILADESVAEAYFKYTGMAPLTVFGVVHQEPLWTTNELIDVLPEVDPSGDIPIALPAPTGASSKDRWYLVWVAVAATGGGTPLFADPVLNVGLPTTGPYSPAQGRAPVFLENGLLPYWSGGPAYENKAPVGYVPPRSFGTMYMGFVTRVAYSQDRTKGTVGYCVISGAAASVSGTDAMVYVREISPSVVPALTMVPETAKDDFVKNELRKLKQRIDEMQSDSYVTVQSDPIQDPPKEANPGKRSELEGMLKAVLNSIGSGEDTV